MELRAGERWTGSGAQETTHLHRHGNVLLPHVVVVLVGVEHDDSIGQSKARIVGHERRAVDLLQRNTANFRPQPITSQLRVWI